MRCNVFQFLQSKHKLRVLGDASFAPTGQKSQQGLSVYHGITSHQRKGGDLVQWRSSRQDLIAKSTCEADLITSSEALQQGENIAIVVAEMTNKSCEIELSSDNAASLHMIRSDSETRHQVHIWIHLWDADSLTQGLGASRLSQIREDLCQKFVSSKTSMSRSRSMWFFLLHH